MLEFEEKGKKAELVQMKVETLELENEGLRKRTDQLKSQMSKKWVWGVTERENFEFKYLEAKRELDALNEIKEDLFREREELRGHRQTRIAKEKIELELSDAKKEINILKSLDLKQERNMGILREERDTRQRKAVILENVGEGDLTSDRICGSRMSKSGF